MSEIPHDLIRQLQISTRAAAGLSDYDPSHPTLPALPSLSSQIAASNSSPHLRCPNCQGSLLRGSYSIICLYCGRRPNDDAVSDPICFTSSVGYKWLICSLRLDGSEMVDPRNKREQDQGQRSAEALTPPLSDYLDFKIHWPSKTEKQETRFADNLSKQSTSFSLPGVDPVQFFPKLNRDVISDPSTEHEQPIEQKVGTTDMKTVDAPQHQNLFQNIKSSEPVVNSFQHQNTDDFSGWEADFQFSGSQKQEGGHNSSELFPDFSSDSGNKFPDSNSTDYSMGLRVDLATQIDTVFGPGIDNTDGKPIENPGVYPAFDDDIWNNLSSVKSHPGGGYDATDGTRDGHKDVQTLQSSRDLSTSADLLQDFQLQPHFTNTLVSEIMNNEHKTMDLDSFGEWNDFTDFSSLQGPSQTGSELIYSTSDNKSPEMDLFNFDSKFEEGNFGSFEQPNLISASNTYSNSLGEINSIMSENPSSIRSDDATSGPPHTSEQPANCGDTVEKRSTEDDVKTLISQMHDLSFMLETDLSIPAGNYPVKD